MAQVLLPSGAGLKNGQPSSWVIGFMSLRLYGLALMLCFSWISLAEAGPMPPEFSGAEVYAQYCARCHTQGVNGAPRPGDSQEWQERLKAGRAGLLLAILKGKNSMPPKGGNASLSVVEANAALDYMLGASAKK